MAQVFLPSYYVDAVGKRCKRESPGAVRKRSKTWHIRYYTPDGKRHCKEGYTDKKATEIYAAELERRGICVDAGALDVSDEHSKTPLAEHLDNYARYLRDKN